MQSHIGRRRLFCATQTPEQAFRRVGPRARAVLARRRPVPGASEPARDARPSREPKQSSYLKFLATEENLEEEEEEDGDRQTDGRTDKRTRRTGWAASSAASRLLARRTSLQSGRPSNRRRIFQAGAQLVSAAERASGRPAGLTPIRLKNERTNERTKEEEESKQRRKKIRRV